MLIQIIVSKYYYIFENMKSQLLMYEFQKRENLIEFSTNIKISLFSNCLSIL